MTENHLVQDFASIQRFFKIPNFNVAPLWVVFLSNTFGALVLDFRAINNDEKSAAHKMMSVYDEAGLDEGQLEVRQRSD